MGLISGDSRGQLFSLDLLFALIPLVLVLGMVASDMDNIMYLVQDTVFRGSTDRVAADTVNTLLNTPGQPNNWEQSASTRIAGIAKIDSTNNQTIAGTISSAKLSALTESDVQNITGSNYGFCMNITSLDGNTSFKTLSTGGGGYNSSASDIVRIEKVALYSRFDVVSSIVGQIRGSGSIRPYSSPPNQFQVSSYYNSTYNYWILVNNSGYTSANVTINSNPPIVMTNLSQAYKINSSYLLSINTVTVNAGASTGNSMNLYIIQVPNSITNVTDVSNLNNILPQGCRFVFYLWTK